jgi:acetyl esterase/lipase
LILRASRRPTRLARAAFVMTLWVSEYPFIAFLALAVSTGLALGQGDLISAGAWVLLGVAAVTAVGLLGAIRRTSLAGSVVASALADQFDDAAGAGAPGSAGPAMLSPLRALRDVLAPFPVRPRSIQRIRNVAYGDAGSRQLMDLYRLREVPPKPGGVLIHFHGGHFQIGRKSRESKPLLYRLASEGWLCISANYRLRAAGRSR